MTSHLRLARLSSQIGRALGLFACCVFGAACSTIAPSVSDYGPAASPIELVDTPFFPQEQYQCGPAALATLLTASGIATKPESLVGQVYLPARQGSLQTEMLAAARNAGRLPYLLTPTLGSITAELAAGRPVLILQNLGVSWAPQWHYAVVIGADATSQQIVLRSGTDARRIMRTPVFLRTWRRSDFWAVTTLKPGELPADPDHGNYLAAVAALEDTGHHEAAREAWRAGLTEWPGDNAQLFGLANAEYALGNYSLAESHYLEALQNDAALLSVRNNLAMTLLAQGRTSDAISAIQTAIDLAAGSSLENELQDTRQLIMSQAGKNPD
jgi:tetratricopeptide (TPR) repeat protein